MNADKLIINGITYVRETTEPVKRIRKRFYIDDNNSVMAFFNNDFGIVTGFSGYRGQAMNAFELFYGEIIISREDFDNAWFKAGLTSSYYKDKLMQELFK